MQLVRTIDEEVWRDFIKKQSKGNIFHTPEMYRVFEQARGYQPALWAVVDSNGCHSPLALMLPVQVTLMQGVLHRLTTRAILYGSMLAVPGLAGKQAVDMLLAAYRQEVKGRVLFTELRNLADMTDLQPELERNGFLYEDHLNYIIDLARPAEDVLQSIGRRTRKIIRRALRDGYVEIDEVTNRADLAGWYQTLQKTYNNVRVALADRSLFEAAFDVLYPKGMAKFLVAKVDGHPAACSLELPYKDVIYGWYGGTDRSYSRYFPNEMLMWHILEWGANNGYQFYDFGGAGKPDEDYGVRNFKAKFSGELVCFGRNICTHSPYRLQLSKFGYALYRRFK